MNSPLTFLKQTQDELKQVTWPSKDEVTRLTLVVLLISVTVGIYIGGIDFLLTEITKIILN